jgi:hypothetical protein
MRAILPDGPPLRAKNKKEEKKCSSKRDGRKITPTCVLGKAGLVEMGLFVGEGTAWMRINWPQDEQCRPWPIIEGVFHA